MPTEEGGTEGTTEGEDTTDTTGVVPPATTSTGSATGETGIESTGEVEPEGVPAAGGIRINFIEANQGIGVRIGSNGEWVGPEGRTAPLAGERTTLVRVFWTVPDSWEPREIEARCVFYLPGGETVEQSEVKMVMGDSFAGSLDETFNFGLLAEEAFPGTGYSVELYEVDESFADPEVTTPPRLPDEEESVLVGFEDSYQKLKVVLVPFNYDGGTCVAEPDLTEETMQLYEDKMFQMNPIDTLEMEIHDTLEWNTELQSLSEVNVFLSELRFEEGAPPETYYFGHINVCGGGLGGAAGIAHGIPQDAIPENAFQRVSTGASFNPELSGETYVHEVGHSQGRRHVACDGEAGIDPMFPQEGGDIGEWGFGVIDFRLRHPTITKDYMTYCTPTWVSNYGWNHVWPTIRTLSTWDPEFPGDGDAPHLQEDPYGGGSLLVGTLLSGGTELWSTVPGGVHDDELTNDTQIEFAIGGEVLVRQAAKIEPIPDSDDRLVITPLPAGFDAVDRMTRIEGSRRVQIDRAQLHVKHHLRTVRR